MSRITTKGQMYRLLSAGEFGNINPQYMSVREWQESGCSGQYELWGVRSQIIGGPIRLYCPRNEVEATVKRFGCKTSISLMVDALLTITLWADIYDSEHGLLVYGIEYPPKMGSWREWMP